MTSRLREPFSGTAEDTVEATGRTNGGTATGRPSDVASEVASGSKREPRALPHMQPAAVEAVRKAQVTPLVFQLFFKSLGCKDLYCCDFKYEDAASLPNVMFQYEISKLLIQQLNDGNITRVLLVCIF